MKKKLSSTQERVYRFMVGYFEMNDQLPSCQAIANNFNWASVNSAVEQQQILAMKGWIERNECGKYRFAREQEASHVCRSGAREGVGA